MAEGGKEISNETTKTWWFLGYREHRWPLEAEQGHDTGLPPCSQSLYKIVMASNWVSGGAIRRRKARGGGRAFSKKGDTRD